jgi:predicted NBD/HSP70 family sugar kinase
VSSDTERAARAGRPGTAAFLRELNHRAVFGELVNTARSRSQLAAKTGLSKPTISGALAHLQRSGLIRPGGFTSGPTGPAAELFELDPRAGFVVGVQLDRRAQVAIADLTGAILARARSPNRVRAASLAASVADLAAVAATEARLDLADASAVVVATPGVPHQPTRSVRVTSLPGVDRPGFLDELDQALHATCVTANDVNLAAVAEHRWGAAAGVADFALVSLAPGLGMSAFIDGRLHSGVHGAAGEVALLPALADHAVDGLSGEAASSAGVVRLAHRLGLDGVRHAHEVYRAAAGGDRTAARAVDVYTRHLALAVAAAVAVLDPALIVVSGAAEETVVARIAAAVRQVNPDGPALVAGSLGEEAVLLGAVAAGLPHAIERVFARSLA